MEINEEITRELLSLAEPEYKKFNSKLIPNIDPDTILGVRIPALRKIASRLKKGEWRAYLEGARDDSFEEILLQGLVISAARMEFPELLERIRGFLPKMDNWAVCDTFCSSLKAAGRYRRELLPWIRQWAASGEAYTIRFAVVMLMDYYMEESDTEEALALLDGIRHEDYYVKMAVAWAISMYYVHFPEIVTGYLRDNSLDDFTYHKALQKITESRRVTAAEKERIRGMKRKKTLD